jgi:alkane 1-monooxygenase
MLLAFTAPTPITMARLRAATAFFPLLLGALVMTSVYFAGRTGWHDAWAWYPLFIIYGPLTLLDYVVGEDTSNGPPAVGDGYFRWLPLLCIPLQFVVLIVAANYFVTAPLSTLGMIGWIMSVGLVSGMIAINVGHELIHKNSQLERIGGGIILATTAYGTFKVEHVLGHHAWVATDRDPSSAKRGESVYTFVPKAIVHNAMNAFRLAGASLKRRGFSPWSWRNELWWWSGITIACAAALGVAFGPMASVFFVGQALGAIVSLEIINYIEHYGLRRHADANGRAEKVTPMHSWNSAYFLTNAFLFQLQRHSDHHASAARRYQELRHHESAPQLPGGYGAMMVLALVPPLWRKVIDPLIPPTAHPTAPSTTPQSA